MLSIVKLHEEHHIDRYKGWTMSVYNSRYRKSEKEIRENATETRIDTEKEVLKNQTIMFVLMFL